MILYINVKHIDDSSNIEIVLYIDNILTYNIINTCFNYKNHL